MFEGRDLVIATKHAKERVVAPVLEQSLGVRCIASKDLDTDLLGSFSGEIERTLNPLEAAREKCRRAMDLATIDLAVASEGSFGPHPAAPMLPGDDELLILVDRSSGLELVAREVSTSTNFAASRIDDEDALLTFADRAGFPSHGLILRDSKGGFGALHKGIVDRERLISLFRELQEQFGGAYVETDMRAHVNPTRMKVIGEAARKLADLALSQCPRCGHPGFAVTEVVRGLPCELCGLPTKGASRHLSVCSACGYEDELRYPNGKTAEDPTYCEFCNP